MNLLSRCQFRSWLRCTSFTLPKIELKAHILASHFQESYFRSFENRCFLHTSTKLLAGHSKWANIKHTKGLKDAEKSLTFSKYGRLLRMASKEAGGSNPKLNFKLARVMEQAKNANMPAGSIEVAIKSIEKSEENAKPGTLVFSAPGGIFIIVDVLTDNIRRTRNEVIPFVKKVNFKEQRGSIEGVFEEKGIIVTKGDLNKAMDDAIEVGAEDVTQEEEVLTFVCDPRDFYSVQQALLKLKYDISYSGLEQLPNIHATIKDSDLDKFKLAFGKLEDHTDVIKIHYNFEL